MSVGRSVLAAGAVLAMAAWLAPATAATVTIDFSAAPSGGAIGTATATWSDASGFTATATCGTTAASCFLTQNVLGSTGLGVRSSSEGAAGNEIDSFGSSEQVGLAFGGGFSVALKSVVLTLVDYNEPNPVWDILDWDTNARLIANGSVLGDNFVPLGIAPGGTASCTSGTLGYGRTCSVDLSAVAGLANLTSLSLGADTGDDSFLWKSAVFEITAAVQEPTEVSKVPLPQALPLFATGAGVLAILKLRRRRVTAATA